MADEDRGVPLIDAALQLRVSYSVLYRLVQLGELRAWRNGKRWMCDPSSLRALERRGVATRGQRAVAGVR